MLPIFSYSRKEARTRDREFGFTMVSVLRDRTGIEGKRERKGIENARKDSSMAGMSTAMAGPREQAPAMELLVSIYGGRCRVVRDVGRKERMEMAKKTEIEGKMNKKKKKSGMMAWKRGAWSAEEDRKLVECVTAHGDKKWRTLAAKAGLFSSPFLLTPSSQHAAMHEPRTNFTAGKKMVFSSIQFAAAAAVGFE
ncbi:hypothetical protein BHE74_00013737 [Ensete ventricosum]|nr:hypothetical protein BHE74_00013737 [Ensete ventricosum]